MGLWKILRRAGVFEGRDFSIEVEVDAINNFFVTRSNTTTLKLKLALKRLTLIKSNHHRWIMLPFLSNSLYLYLFNTILTLVVVTRIDLSITSRFT